MIKHACEGTTVAKIRNLKNDYYSLTLGPLTQAKRCKPGNFVHVKLPCTNIYFRRAMSVASVDPDKKQLEIIFRVFGRGTTLLSKFRAGDELDVLGPLGNSFSRPKKNERVVCIAGGIGFPPLLFYAADLVARGYDPGLIDFYYGGRSAPDIIERARIKKLGVNFYPLTEDGSFGKKGLVTEEVIRSLKERGTTRTRLYACGPEGMLKAVDILGQELQVPGELSLEAPMPCGIGVCLGCIVPLTKGGYARVCADGPVFQIGEVKL